VYEPKRKYAEIDKPAPPKLGYSLFGWVKPVWSYTEEELLAIVGLDAITFLRFIRMCSIITTVLSVILGATLIPVSLVYNLKYNKASSYSTQSTALSVITVAEMYGTFLWAPIIMSYFAVIVALFFIFKNYQHMVRLRWAFFRSDAYQNSFAARTLMLTGVSRDLQSDEALSSLLSTIGMPYPTTEVHIGRVMGSLPEIVELHDDTVRKLERVLASYLKDPNNVSQKRPTVRVHKTMGMFGGERVDAIDHYTAQINKLEASIENWRDRIAERKPESYGFASMGAVPYAHAAAKSLKGKKPRGVKIELAPEPRDILWKNLVMSATARFTSNFFGFLYLSIVVFFNAVPLLAVALIAQMSSFIGTLGFLKAWHNASAWSFAAVAGLVPPAISGVMGYFLPIIMRRIAKYRGERTRTQLDKVVTGQYFAFMIVSQFVLFTLIGILITSIATIVSEISDHKSAGAVFDTLRQQTVVVKKQYLNMSNYWLTWIPLRFYLSIFDLAQVLKLLLVWFRKGLLGRTPRDVREYTKPPNFEYSIYYANLLFLFAVGLLYACLAPLVIIFTAAAFWISLAVYKYQLMYVCVTKVESGGQLWRVIVNRLLASIIFMQLILIFVVALDDTVSTTARIIKAVASVPPIAIVIGFKIYCVARFDRQFDWYIPEAPEMASIKVHGGDVRHNRLQRRFGHPSLHQKLFTPMVHAKVKHLLPLVYRGRLEQAGTMDVDGRKVEAEEVTGGLRIAAVEEYQLEYDPKMDSDNQSVISTSTFASKNRFGGQSRMGTADTAHFQNMHKQYLAGGNGRDGMGMDDYEMGAMRNNSQENLLEKASHGRKASNMTYTSSQNGGGLDYVVSQTTPGLEYPPGRSPAADLSQIPLTHHMNDSQISVGSNGGYFATPGIGQGYPVQSPYYNAASQYQNAGTPPAGTYGYRSASPGPMQSSPSGPGQPQRYQGRPSPGATLPFDGPNVAANMYNTPPSHQYQQPQYQQRPIDGPRYQQQQQQQQQQPPARRQQSGYQDYQYQGGYQ